MSTPKAHVALVVLHREGRVLLQHRDDKPGIAWPGGWAIFGGHLEPGEEPEAAAIREIREELGLELEPPLDALWTGEDETRVRHAFAAPLPVPPEALTLTEGQGMALVGPEQVAELPVPPVHRQILAHFWSRR